jgi:hypothetical protein
MSDDFPAFALSEEQEALREAVRALADDKIAPLSMRKISISIGCASPSGVAIRHAGAETSRERSAHIAQIILDGLRPQPDIPGP